MADEDVKDANSEDVKGTKVDPQDPEWGESRIVEPEVSNEGGKATPLVELGEEKPEEEKKEENQEEEEVVEDQLIDVEPTVTVEDPGKYEPEDYSFEVNVYDAEGKNGRRKIINSIDEWEQLLETEPNLGSSLAVNKAFREAQNMESSLKTDKSDWEKKKEAFNEQKKLADAQWAETERTAKEITYLVSKGKLPKVDAKYANANWSDPQVAKQPGVKEQVALLKYQMKENAERNKLGLSPMSVLDAFNALQNEELEKGDKKQKKEAGEKRKEAGAKVAGASSAPSAGAPKGVAVGRGGSLRDLDAGWGW